MRKIAILWKCRLVEEINEIKFRIGVEVFSQRFPMDFHPRNPNPKSSQKSDLSFPPFRAPQSAVNPRERENPNFVNNNSRKMKPVSNERSCQEKNNLIP